MLSSGANVIIWDNMISCGANVLMLSFGSNFIIWCYHVMLSSGMITPPFFIFPENFTHSIEFRSSAKQKPSVELFFYLLTCCVCINNMKNCKYKHKGGFRRRLADIIRIVECMDNEKEEYPTFWLSHDLGPPTRMPPCQRR